MLTTSNAGMRDIWRNLEAHVVLHLFLTIGMSSNGRELILDYFRMTKHAYNSLSFVSQYVIVVVNTIVSNLYTVATLLDMVPKHLELQKSKGPNGIEIPSPFRSFGASS